MGFKIRIIIIDIIWVINTRIRNKIIEIRIVIEDIRIRDKVIKDRIVIENIIIKESIVIKDFRIKDIILIKDIRIKIRNHKIEGIIWMYILQNR